MSELTGHHAGPADPSTVPERQTADLVHVAMVVGAAFGLYWLSSFVLQARNATTHFGADSWYYSELAQGNIFERIPSNTMLDRVVRFHPLTVVLAAMWMNVLAPLTLWLAPLQVLKAMFAAIGAAGVGAAMSAFAAVVPRRYVVLFGIIYAVSFGAWFFSSIEESKILTASLSAFYIARYLHLRTAWTGRGAVELSAILLLACLNEMTAVFLLAIPAVDTVLRHGLDWRQGRWIAAHALAFPAAFMTVEVVLYSLLPAPTNPEGMSHLGMLLYYLAKHSRDAAMLHGFVANWLFFNLAAPTPTAPYWAPPGFFEPSLLNYLRAPGTTLLTVLLGVMIAASVLKRFRTVGSASSAPILLALLAYALVRGVFFFFFNPIEPLLFSPPATLAHMLLLAIPFAASRFRPKRALLATVATVLFFVNEAFILGW